MALTDENGMNTTMLVSPAGGMGYPYPVYQQSGGNGGNDGFGGENGWWIVLFIILLAVGGWNNGGNQNGGGMFGGIPYVINNDSGSIQRGFDQASVMSGINEIQSSLCNGFSNVQQSLCNGFAGVNQNVSNGFAQAEIADNARQIANMQQAFANQTAITNGINNLSSQFADCCCENRLGLANLNSTIISENCADRYEASNNTRDIIASQTAGFQRILDQMCNDKIDAKNEKIADLERQLTMADLRASQIAQTAEIQRGQVAEVDALYDRLSNCPVPSMPVYGSQPIFTCPNSNNGCGCGNF